MTHMHYLECCGVAEYHGTASKKTPKDIVDDIIYHFQDEGERKAFVVFTCAGKKDIDTIGTPTVKYIRENKLGTVTVTPVHVNPNTGNPIRVYVWKIPKKLMEKWVPGDDDDVW